MGDMASGYEPGGFYADEEEEVNYCYDRKKIYKISSEYDEDNYFYLVSDEYLDDYIDEAEDRKELFDMLAKDNIDYSICFPEDYEEQVLEGEE